MADLLLLPRSAEGWFSGEKPKNAGLARYKKVASARQSENFARAPQPPVPKGKRSEPSVQIMTSRSVNAGKSSILAKRES